MSKTTTYCIAILMGVVAIGVLRQPENAALSQVVGLTYDDARVVLLREGWTPRQDAGDGMLSGNGHIFHARGYTELVASSGTGLAPCRFEFTDRRGRVLVVGTEGEECEDGYCHAKVVHASLEQD